MSLCENCQISDTPIHLEANGDNAKTWISQAINISYDGMVMVGYRQKSRHAEREAMKWIVSREPSITEPCTTKLRSSESLSSEPPCVYGISPSAMNNNQSAWAAGVSGDCHFFVGQISRHQSFTIPYRDGIMINQSDDTIMSPDLYIIYAIGYDRSHKISLSLKGLEEFDIIKINEVSSHGHTANILMISVKIHASAIVYGPPNRVYSPLMRI